MVMKDKNGPVSDEDLMVRFKNGDQGAINELINRNGSALYGYIVRQTGDPHRAEDAYQEVFLRVVKSAKRYRPQASFRAWLFTIARNVVIDMARKESYRRAESLDKPAGDEGGAARMESMDSGAADPEENAKASEMSEILEEAIASLAEEQREVFLLREKTGLSFKEIAAATGAPLNTVKTRMHYALNHLRKALREAGMMDGA